MKLNIRLLLLTVVCALCANLLFSNDIKTVRLQLKWKHQFQFAGYYAAVEKGYYREAGLNVEILEAQPNETPFDAVFSGKAEFGVCTTDILVARSKGLKPVILADIFQHSPHIIIAMKNSNIRYIHDLAGKKIAAEPGAADLYAFLLSEGVALSKFHVEELDFSMDKFLSGEVDAITAYSTDEIYPLRQAGHELNILYPATSGIDFYGDLLFTSADLIKKDPDLVKAFTMASLLGWDYALSHKEEIVNLIWDKYSHRHTKDHLRFEAKETAKLILPEVVEIGYTNPGRWSSILESYKKLGRVDSSQTIDGLLYADYQRQKLKIPWRLIVIFSLALTIAFAFLYSYYRSYKMLQKEILKREIVQSELAASEALYRSILKASPDDITVTDMQGVIQVVSTAAIQMLGTNNESELIGRNVSEFTLPEDLELAKMNSKRMLEGVHHGPAEYTLVKIDGSTLDIEMNTELIKDVEGKPTGIVMIVRDIRERKQRENEIRQKNAELVKINAEKDKFFSIISHDLRSPFNAFLGITEVLVDKIDHMPLNEIRKFAKDLNKSATTLYRLLENLLEWSRIERGLTVPNASVFSINKIIAETQKMLMDSAQAKNLTVYTDLVEDYMVETDYLMSETVLRNLYSNAVKYTPRGGWVSISTKQTADSFVEVSIKDNGIGMSQAILDSLFKIDANNNRMGTEGESSTGLGLILCKEFVELNGGVLKVNSVEGKGSIFTFTLKSALEDQQ